jgi:hypothetical protein
MSHQAHERAHAAALVHLNFDTCSRPSTALSIRQSF